MATVMTDVALMKNYIGGKWVEAEASGTVDITNPSTGEVIGEVPLSTRPFGLTAIVSFLPSVRRPASLAPLCEAAFQSCLLPFEGPRLFRFRRLQGRNRWVRKSPAT